MVKGDAGWLRTRPATWARHAARLRRNAEELRAEGWAVTEPKDFSTPPEQRMAKEAARRIANTS